MTHPFNGTYSAHLKNDIPFAIRRIVIIGLYDGALDGVLESSTGEAYRFEIHGNEDEAVLLKQRTYELRKMPTDALDRLVELLSPHVVRKPTWPVWIPRSFIDEETEKSVEPQMDAILNNAGPVVGLITTEDFYGFSVCTFEAGMQEAVLTNLV